MFIKTKKQFELGSEIFILLRLLDEAEKFPIAGKVAWVTPAGAQGGMPEGIGVQFVSDDAIIVRNKIETYIPGALKSDKRTDTL